MLTSLLYVLISGIALPVGGIQMQYLWRNQLGDVYSLGLGSAACLGAAAATMSGWCSLTMGSFICTLIAAMGIWLGWLLHAEVAYRIRKHKHRERIEK